MRVPSSLLRRKGTIEPYLGDTARGPRWGSAVAVRGRLEGKRRAVRRADGVDVISSASFTIRPTIEVRPESRVVVEGRTYEVLDVVVGEGLSSSAYLELVLGGPK